MLYVNLTSKLNSDRIKEIGSITNLRLYHLDEADLSSVSSVLFAPPAETLVSTGVLVILPW